MGRPPLRRSPARTSQAGAPARQPALRPGRYDQREPFPICFMFGRGPIAFLSVEEASRATTVERIRSVWPCLVRRVLDFHATLRPRARANYDPEDILAEIYTLLVAKDPRWSPSRGRYFSFAFRLVTNELHALRDRASTVPSPRNSTSRLRAYLEDQAAGRLSARKAESLSRLRQVLSAQEAIEGNPEHETVVAPDHSDGLAHRDDSRRLQAAIRRALAKLPPTEVAVIGRLTGVGPDDTGPARLSQQIGLTVHAVRLLSDRTLACLRAELHAAGFAPADYEPEEEPEEEEEEEEDKESAE